MWLRACLETTPALAARRAFGGVEQAKEHHRDARGLARFGMAQGHAIFAAEGPGLGPLLPRSRYGAGDLRLRRDVDGVCRGRGRRPAGAACDRTTNARHVEAGKRHRRASPGTHLNHLDHRASGHRGRRAAGDRQNQLVWNPTQPDQSQLQRGILPRGDGQRGSRCSGRGGTVRLRARIGFAFREIDHRSGGRPRSRTGRG